jgi:hypothetical protein
VQCLLPHPSIGAYSLRGRLLSPHFGMGGERGRRGGFVYVVSCLEALVTWILLPRAGGDVPDRQLSRISVHMDML